MCICDPLLDRNQCNGFCYSSKNTIFGFFWQLIGSRQQIAFLTYLLPKEETAFLHRHRDSSSLWRNQFTLFCLIPTQTQTLIIISKLVQATIYNSTPHLMLIRTIHHHIMEMPLPVHHRTCNLETISTTADHLDRFGALSELEDLTMSLLFWKNLASTFSTFELRYVATENCLLPGTCIT